MTTAYIIMRHIGPLSWPVACSLDIHVASLERQRLDKVLAYAKHTIKAVTMLETKTPATSAGVVVMRKD